MSLEAEQSTIGGLMMDNNRFHDISLDADDFFHPTHRAIFLAIKELIIAGQPADLTTVAEWIERNKGTPFQEIEYLGQLVENTPTAANVHIYAELVLNESKRRQAIGILTDGMEEVKEDGASGIDSVISKLMLLVDGNKKYECTITDTVIQAAERLEWLQNNPGLIGLSTGLMQLDDFLGGFQKPDLYVIGSRPAMGKTAWMLNMVLAAEKPIGLFSAEQPKIQIGQRMIAIAGGASSTNMRRGKMNDDDWNATSTTLARLKNRIIMINDKSAPTLVDIVRQTRRWKREFDIHGIYLDYIQRMRGPAKLKRHEQVEEIVRGLKETAKELDISVVALAQVNRDVEKRKDKRPHMSDLRDSGAIEQEADNIMMLYRDEVYNANTRHAGMAEISIEKHRHGPTGFLYAEWIADNMIFKDPPHTKDAFDG